MSALELVHHCTSRDRLSLQRNSLRISIEILHLLCELMRVDDLRIDLRDVAPDGVSRASVVHSHAPSVADRLSAHNSAEVLLTIFESLMDELNEQRVAHARSHAHASDNHFDGDGDEERGIKLRLVEAILRCLDTQLEVCTIGSVHRTNLLKHLYLFIPSHLQGPPTGEATSPGDGSDSEIIRLLVGLLRHRHSDESASLSARLLRHLCGTTIANDHVHAARCMQAGPPCTRATPPAPVVTFPAYANSILAVASKLFRFPHSPAIYLVEKADLLEAYLGILRGVTHTECAMEEMTPPRVLTKMKPVCDDSTEDDSEPAFLALAPNSPPSASRCHQLFMHEPHLHAEMEDGAHHASFAVSEQRFMVDSYTTAVRHAIAKPIIDQIDPAPGTVMQLLAEKDHSTTTAEVLSAPPPPPSASSNLRPAPVHAAPVWHSNELTAAALGGLASLCANNAVISLHICNQRDIIPMMARLLSHPEVGLNLVVTELIGTLERALSTPDCSCASRSHTACTHAGEPPSLSAFLNGTVKRVVAQTSRRSSDGSVLGRRRNSLGGSPLLQAVPAPLTHKALLHHSNTGSPKITPLTAHTRSTPLMNATSPLLLHDTRAAAHARLVPLVSRSIRMIIDVMQRRWTTDSDRPVAIESDVRLVRLLSHLVPNSRSFQEDAADAIPILTSLLANPTQASSMREACISCLAHLCSLHEPNRTLVVESRVLSTVALPLLAILKPCDQRRRTDRSEEVHPSVSLLQLACVRLCTSVSAGFVTMAVSRLLASDMPATSTAIGHMLLELVSFLDGRESTIAMQVMASALMHRLVFDPSPMREILVDAGVVPKLVSLCAMDRESADEAAIANDAQCPHCSPRTDDSDVTLTPTRQVRLNALAALASLTSCASVSVKQSVLGELSLDGIFALLETASEGREGAQAEHERTCADVHHVRRLAECAWDILRHLCEPVDADPDVGSEEQAAASDVTSTPNENGKPTDALLSRDDITRVLDVIRARIQDASFHAAESHAPILAAIAARTDASRSLICERPSLLAHVHTAIMQPGESLERATECAIHLLQPTPTESKQSESDRRGSDQTIDATALTKRLRTLLEHRLLPTIIALAETETTTVLPIACHHAPITPSEPCVAEELRHRLRQGLVSMHASLVGVRHESPAAQAHWSMLDEFVAEQHRSSCMAPNSSPASELTHDADGPMTPPSGEILRHLISHRVETHRTSRDRHHIHSYESLGEFPPHDSSFIEATDESQQDSLEDEEIDEIIDGDATDENAAAEQDYVPPGDGESTSHHHSLALTDAAAVAALIPLAWRHRILHHALESLEADLLEEELHEAGLRHGDRRLPLPHPSRSTALALVRAVDGVLAPGAGTLREAIDVMDAAERLGRSTTGRLQVRGTERQ